LFLSKLGGTNRPAEIADWIKFRLVELKSLLNLEWKKSPPEVTVKRILEAGKILLKREDSMKFNLPKD
jgi:hypothetical protein